MPDGAAVLRSADPELQLQGLRTALSLALGDRHARVYVLGHGRGVLAAPPDSEAGRCLAALHEAGIEVIVEGQADSLLEAIVGAAFQQTF